MVGVAGSSPVTSTRYVIENSRLEIKFLGGFLLGTWQVLM